MANSVSARKRIRQNDKHRLHNKSRMSELRTLIKKLNATVAAKDADGARALHATLVSKLDRAGQRRLLHPNNVARKKSHLARLVNALGA